MRVAVLGGSGKTGRAIAAALESRAASVTSVGRREWGDLVGVLRGCDAVSVIAPNFHPDEPAYVAEVLAAVEAAGVTRLVYHSVATPYAPAMPHHLGKARSEDLVRRSPTAWTVLQPCAYVQNLVPALRSAGSLLEVPYAVDRPFGLVDLHDVAEATARVLLDDGHVGATYELGGPTLVTVADVAHAAGDCPREAGHGATCRPGLVGGRPGIGAGRARTRGAPRDVRVLRPLRVAGRRPGPARAARRALDAARRDPGPGARARRLSNRTPAVRNGF